MRGDGFKSRKLWLVVFSQALVIGFALTSTKLPALIPMFPTLAGTITGLVAIFCGANLGEQHIGKPSPPKIEQAG